MARRRARPIAGPASPTSRRRNRVALASVAALAATAAALAVLLTSGGKSPYEFIRTPPTGYTATSAGKLTDETATRATISDSKSTATQLSQHGYRGGRAKSWTDNGDTIQIAIFSFKTKADAEAFMAFELNYAVELAGGGAQARRSILFPVPGVPQATGFFADGLPRNNQPLFITGSWFVAGPRAYLVEHASETPTSSTLAIQVTQSEAKAIRS